MISLKGKTIYYEDKKLNISYLFENLKYQKISDINKKMVFKCTYDGQDFQLQLTQEEYRSLSTSGYYSNSKYFMCIDLENVRI